MKLTESKLRSFISREIRTVLRESAKPRKRSLVSLIFEDAAPEKIEDNRFPLTLSAVDMEAAKKLVSTGDKDGEESDDVVSVEENAGLGPCGDLKPSQTSMDLSKAWMFALSMINGTMPGSGGPGGNLAAFVSNDNYIMDGHHRWIATFMVDPSSELTGNKVNLPGQKLVAVLNAITKGLLGVESGNAGTGGFDQFKDAGAMKAELEAQLAGKAKSQGPIGGSPEDVKAKLKEWTGVDDDSKVVDATLQKVMENLKGLPSQIMPNAPDRADMPVIDDKKSSGATAKTIDALEKGKIDLNPPYAKGAQTAGRVRDGEVMIERWQKLAGLIK